MPTQTASAADSPAPAAGRSAQPRRWRTALRRTPVSLWNDDVTDWAAALTYYAILSLLPALLVTVSVIGLANPDATGALIADITSFAPAESGE
ncbi:YhjD/YihY/BrkB family envelope integrity protein, partial [Streptomyces sp. ADI98-10]